MRILVIDHDAASLSCLQEACKERNHEFFLATDAKTGLELYRSKQPDIVITEVALQGGKSGLEVLLTLQFDDPDARVITMSGKEGGNLSWLENSKKFGALTTLEKPLKPEAILQVIDDVAEFSP